MFNINLLALHPIFCVYTNWDYYGHNWAWSDDWWLRWWDWFYMCEMKLIVYFCITQFMSKLAPLVGKDITINWYLDRFCHLCHDKLFQVRKVCASSIGEMATVVGINLTEHVLVSGKICACNMYIFISILMTCICKDIKYEGHFFLYSRWAIFAPCVRMKFGGSERGAQKQSQSFPVAVNPWWGRRY